MNNTPWTEEELADLTMDWPEFHEAHPNRSKHARRIKIGELKRGYKPRTKAPVINESTESDTVTDEELWEATVAYAKVNRRAFLSQKDHRIRVETKEPIAVAFMSDWHIGAEGCDYERLAEDCELIAKHPQLYAAVGGDPVDNFVLKGMAEAARSQVVGVPTQWRHFRYLMQKIQSSTLWVSSGNHDAWTQKAAALDGVLSALHDIPVVYTGEGAYVDLVVGEQTYTVWRKHKPTRFSSMYNLTHFLKQMLRTGLPKEYDIGISEHLHESNIEIFEYRPGTKIDRVLIACGSYKVIDTYADGLGYYGGGYGVPTVILYPDSRRMLPFKSIADALEVLDGPSLGQAAA